MKTKRQKKSARNSRSSSELYQGIARKKNLAVGNQMVTDDAVGTEQNRIKKQAGTVQKDVASEDFFSCLSPEWQPRLSAYRKKTLLRFETEEDLDAAIEFLWSDRLRTLPHDTPDGNSLIIPSEAVELFSNAGLRFRSSPLQSIRDLSLDEIRKLRR